MSKTEFAISNKFGQFQYWHDCDDSRRYRGIMRQVKRDDAGNRTFECMSCGTFGEVAIPRMQAGRGSFVVLPQPPKEQNND